MSWNTQDKYGRALGEFEGISVPDVLLVQEAGGVPGIGMMNKYGITVGSVDVQRRRRGYNDWDTKAQTVYFAHVNTGSKNIMTLSIYPIENAHTLDLTTDQDKDSWRFRPALAVEVGGNPIVNFHLVSGFERMAKSQLDVLVDSAQHSSKQVFMGGDANMESDKFTGCDR